MTTTTILTLLAGAAITKAFDALLYLWKERRDAARRRAERQQAWLDDVRRRAGRPRFYRVHPGE